MSQSPHLRGSRTTATDYGWRSRRTDLSGARMCGVGDYAVLPLALVIGCRACHAAPTQGPSAPVLVAGSAGSIPLTLTAPSGIEIKGRQFKVIPVEVAKGAWPYQRGTLAGDKAVWVYGTLINYVIGLEASPDATMLLQDLTEADVIKLTTYSGRAVLFRYSGRQWVTVDKTDVFRQMRPGLTLVLLGERAMIGWCLGQLSGGR